MISLAKIMKSFMLFMMMTAMVVNVDAQSVKSDVITEYKGKQYYIHTVQKKQTLKDISKMYDVDVADIQKENKDLGSNVRPGSIIRIPYVENVEMEEIVAEDTVWESNDTTLYVESHILKNFDAEREYKVALMMPLYLEQVDSKFIASEAKNKLLLSKPLKAIVNI